VAESLHRIAESPQKLPISAILHSPAAHYHERDILLREAFRMRKILIVDDSAVVRDRLIQLLSGLQEMEIAGEAGDAERGRELMKKLKPDVIIIDVQMRNGGGIDLLQDMKRMEPASRVIVLTNEAYPEIRNRCLDAGADYFFDKSTEYQEMVTVLGGIPLRSGAH
jgi:DNA-binding NarL/FixJ family response regulator